MSSTSPVRGSGKTSPLAWRRRRRGAGRGSCALRRRCCREAVLVGVVALMMRARRAGGSGAAQGRHSGHCRLLLRRLLRPPQGAGWARPPGDEQMQQQRRASGGPPSAGAEQTAPLRGLRWRAGGCSRACRPGAGSWRHRGASSFPVAQDDDRNGRRRYDSSVPRKLPHAIERHLPFLNALTGSSHQPPVCQSLPFLSGGDIIAPPISDWASGEGRRRHAQRFQVQTNPGGAEEGPVQQQQLHSRLLFLEIRQFQAKSDRAQSDSAWSCVSVYCATREA